ncbi:hypothetical protein ACTJI8_18775 [Microbacterium sp. 22303]|uniref:hypothetical protein n=1 Tax=Microbacterium sp. 22303 TaxID=3453905 RepID=UPI003F863FCC
MTWREQAREWRSGAWSLELRDDELADIAFGSTIALRSVRAVVRDRNWETARLEIEDIAGDGGELTLHVRVTRLGVHLVGTIRVIADGSRLAVHLDLEAHEDFWTNRTGIVVLHPAGVAGERLQVRHSDGRHEASLFPADISPHQPVFDIEELDWDHAGLGVSVKFAGDVFEMEDQRNWTDASFKTYSRPLALPFPYLLAAGTHVRQSVTIQARRTGTPEPQEPNVLTLRPAGIFPEVGLGAATAADPAPPFDPVGSAVLVELDLATSNWRAALARASTAGLPLDVRFVLSEAEPASIAAGVAALRGLAVARVAAFAPSGRSAHVSDRTTTAALRSALDAVGIDVPVVGGTRSHFTELNREQDRLPDDLDGILFSITPLFHAPGTDQLVESLAMQRLTAAQSVRIARGVPVHIGPVTLRPRFNNVATTAPPMPVHGDLREGYGPHLLDAHDERQDAPELAAWLVASAAALAAPGVSSLTFFEEWGPRGILRADGSARPVASALRALTGLSGRPSLRGATPDELVWAVGAVGTDGRETVLIANLDRAERDVLAMTTAGSTRVRIAAGEWLSLPA